MSKYHTWYQLMDQSVTATFKPDCFSTVNQAIWVACKKYALNLTKYWKGHSIWSAVNNTKDSWDEIKVSTTSWNMSFSDLVVPTQYSTWMPCFHKNSPQCNPDTGKIPHTKFRVQQLQIHETSEKWFQLILLHTRGLHILTENQSCQICVNNGGWPVGIKRVISVFYSVMTDQLFKWLTWHCR